MKWTTTIMVTSVTALATGYAAAQDAQDDYVYDGAKDQDWNSALSWREPNGERPPRGRPARCR